MTLQPELSRRIPLRRLGIVQPAEERLVVEVDAAPGECAALARRLEVPAVAALSCRFTLSGVSRNGVVEADGLLQARLTQVCVVTDEPFEVVVTERFSLRFVPADRLAAQPDAALDLEADDDVPYEDGVVDLGEAAVEQLALALDPYPHKPGAERPAGLEIGDPPLTVEGADHDPDAADGSHDAAPGPFAALARLRPGGSAD